MAPDPAFSTSCFFSFQCWCNQTGGQRKLKGSPGFLFVLFVFSSCFFLSFPTVNFVKQAVKLCICFLFLPHDVNSFHSSYFCGELIDSCEEGMSGCITVFSRFICVCFLEPSPRAGRWDNGGLGRSKQTEREGAAKFYPSQQKQNKCRGQRAQQRSLSLTPMTSDPQKPPIRPSLPSPAFQQSHTLNLPSFLHAPASPRQQLTVRHAHRTAS